MRFSIRNLIKPILGLFLFGLALWANPLEASAFGSYGVTQPIPNGTTLPYSYFGFWPNEIGTISPSGYSYNPTYTLPLDLPLTSTYTSEYSFDFDFSMVLASTLYGVTCDNVVRLSFNLYYYDHNNVLTYLPLSSQAYTFDKEDGHYPTLHITIPVFCPGKPDHVDVSISTYWNGYSYVPWIFAPNPSYSGSAIPDTSSSTQTFTITGYSEPVNSHIQDIELIGNGGNAGKGYSGYVNLHSSAITLTGSVPFDDPDYDISFSQDDVNPSGSFYTFGIFSSVSDYTLFYDGSMNESLDNIESYTSTMVDQFEEFFDYQPPNTQSFNSDKSTVDSSINTVTTFQNTAFSGLNSAVNDTGLNSFDFAEYGPQMSYVGLLLTSIYNVFPNKFRYVIYFVLFIGFFGVLLNAGHYIKKMRDSE